MSSIKYKIIQEILFKKGPAPSKDILDRYVTMCFMTKRSGSSLRLTIYGNSLFIDSGVEQYIFEFTKRYTDKEYKTLITEKTNNIKCPFYVNNEFPRTFTVYNGKIATMIGLYGTIDDYLKSID